MTTTPAAEPRLSDKIGRFVAIPHSFVEDMPNLPQCAIALFLYLRYKANISTDEAFPSYESIERDTGMTRPTISKALKALINRQWIKARRRFSSSTIYEICIPPISKKSLLMDDKNELPVVKNFNCISKDSLLPLVKNLYPNKNQLTKTNQQEQQDAGASNADADFYLSIWNELKTHGITRNKKTSEIVKRFAGCEHALDIIRAEAKNIGNDKKNKAGVLVDVLANYDIATYTPPVKNVIRLIDEY